MEIVQKEENTWSQEQRVQGRHEIISIMQLIILFTHSRSLLSSVWGIWTEQEMRERVACKKESTRVVAQRDGMGY